MRCNGGHFLDSVFLINNSDYSFFKKKKMDVPGVGLALWLMTQSQ
jgi:hypothetical protein